jgi:hypothetical protein
VSDWDDLPYDVGITKIDDDTMDRLLAGRIDPDDAPPGYAEVARILQAAGSPPRGEHLSREVEHVAAARRVMSPGSASTGGTGGGPSRRRRALAGLIVTGALAGIPGLAAANALPGPAQHAVSRVFDKVGISVPDTLQAPQTSGDHPASTGAEISSIATTTDATGVAKGALISSTASGGKSQAGQHGGAATAHGSAPVATPNAGGTGTPDTASGGSADQGTATADQNSGGRSAAGSGNAQTGSG